MKVSETGVPPKRRLRNAWVYRVEGPYKTVPKYYYLNWESP